MTSSDPRVGRAWSLIVLEALDVWKHLPTGILLCLVPTAALRNTVHLGLWQSCNLGPLFWIFIFLYVDECLLTAPEYLPLSTSARSAVDVATLFQMKGQGPEN